MTVTFRFYQVRCSLRVSPRIPVQIEASILDSFNKEITSASVIRGAGTSKIFQILYRNEEVILRDTVLFRVRLPGKNDQHMHNIKSIATLPAITFYSSNFFFCLISPSKRKKNYNIIAIGKYIHAFALMNNISIKYIHTHTIRKRDVVESKNIRQSIERAEFSLNVELWFGEQAPGSLNLVSTRMLQLNFHPIRGLHYHLPVLFDYFHMASISLGIHASLIAFQYNG